jgi:hypothetical protein
MPRKSTRKVPAGEVAPQGGQDAEEVEEGPQQPTTESTEREKSAKKGSV